MVKILLGTGVLLQLLQIGISIIIHFKLKKMEDQETIIEGDISRLNAATNKIATTLKTLRDEVVGIAKPETLAALDQSIQQLEAIGSDPANPVPTTPTGDQPPVDAGTGG